MPDIIKKFFDTFEIEPREFKSCNVGSFCPYEGQLCDDTCPYYKTYKVDYPAISDHILLELICILGNNSYFLITDEGLPIDINGLKKSVLHSLTLQAKFDKNKVLKQQIQELFKGE